MNFLTPCFQYNPGSGNVNFIPTYPPINKQPQGSLNAVRHDSITSSGKKQSVSERLENLNTFEFANVPQADMANWNAFLGYALGGGQFTWFADSTNLAGGTLYTLEDTAWDPKRTAFQNFAFTIKVRKVV
jgi:hypothetical protein